MTTFTLIPQDPPTEPPPPASTGSPFSFLPFILVGVVFWMLLIGPERKNRKKRDEMLSGLAKGDKVMTTGGLHGQVSKVDEETVTLVVAEGVRLKFARAAVQGVIEEGNNRKSSQEVEEEKVEA